MAGGDIGFEIDWILYVIAEDVFKGPIQL